MKVIVLKPKAQPEVRELPDDYPYPLAQLQEIVGGYIETACTLDLPPEHGQVVVYCNEEGKLKKMPFNCYRRDGEMLVGTLVAVRVDDDGEQQTFDEGDLRQAMKLLESMAASRKAS